MTDSLSKGATELVREGRQALRPTDLDKARVLAAIQHRLVAGDLAPTDTARAPSASAGGMTMGRVAAFAAGVVATVAAFIVYTRGQSEAQPQAVEASSAAVVLPSDATAPSAVSEATEQSTQAIASASTTAPLARSGRRSDESDRLAEEVALLTRAEKEFHAGNLKRALVAADEHRLKFPKGVLAQERVSLRIQVLCGLGRNDEAESEATRFGGQASASAQVCGTGR